ncbi:MAG: putative O-glycosylation ligase, exosortase A system-associated [Casimicrobiaceae bacterium]
MRDYALLAFMMGAIPYAVIQPVFGVYLWTWISVMSPHRLTWGFAYDMPFAFYAALATIIGLLLTKQRRRLPIAPPTIALLLFLAWTVIGYPFSFSPANSYDMLDKVVKIQLMTFVAAALILKRESVRRLTWVLVASLGFFGIKGGLFTIRNAGVYRVWGPSGSFIEGNNELALALIVVIPLMWYLFETTTKRYVKIGLAAAMGLTALAAIGSYSRGALLAIAAMAVTLWWYSKRKALLGLVLLTLGPAIIAFMPGAWDVRMSTITNYTQDASAMGRINAWWMAWNLAKAHPLFGGGFSIYDPSTFALYAPNPTDVHAAHSIYFQILGEHGFVGLFFFLLIWWLTWRTAVWIRTQTTPDGPDRWAFYLAAMTQVSLVGYFVGGAFLSLAYFDLPYYIMVLLVSTKWILVQQIEASSATVATGVSSRATHPEAENEVRVGA